jgi:Tfp pilus assembly protein PilV
MRKKRTAAVEQLRVGADNGFTLIEILLAMFITVAVMTALLGVVVTSLKTVAQARQRQTATALATRSLEQLRALPYTSSTGVDATTYPKTAGLQYVTGSTFDPTPVLTSISETLVVNQFSGKRSSKAIDGVTYTVQTYVTKPAATTAGAQAFNLTSIVSWASSVYPTTRSVAQRSTTFSPNGCLSTSQHPFAGPCQAYFTARAGLSPAGFAVTNANTTLNIPGIDGNLVELNLPVLNTNLQIEQTASGSANAATSGSLAVPSSPDGFGAKAVSVSVDSDPSSIPAQSATKTAVAQTAGPASLTGTAGTFRASPTSADTANSAAAIEADSTTCKDGDLNGSALFTGPAGQLRPCASGSQRQSGSSGQITFTPATFADAVAVVSLAQAPQSSRAVAGYLATANTAAGACAIGAGAIPPGCSHSRVYRSLGDLVVGKPASPYVVAGLDARGLFSVTSLVETAVAERGIGAGAPAYTRTGTLDIWNGTGYTSVPLANYASPGTPGNWDIPSVTTTYPGGFTVTMSGHITVQRPVVPAPTGSADCKAIACVAEVDGGGALHAVTNFTVNTAGGAQITTFVLVSELGGAKVQSTYKAAPDA